MISFRNKMFKSGEWINLTIWQNSKYARQNIADFIPAYMHVEVIWARICNEGRLCFTWWWDPLVEVTTQSDALWENSKKKKNDQYCSCSHGNAYIFWKWGTSFLTPLQSIRQKGQCVKEKESEGQCYAFTLAAHAYILLCITFTCKLTHLCTTLDV